MAYWLEVCVGVGGTKGCSGIQSLSMSSVMQRSQMGLRRHRKVSAVVQYTAKYVFDGNTRSGLETQRSDSCTDLGKLK